MGKTDLKQIYELLLEHCSEDWLFLLKERSKKKIYKKNTIIYQQNEKVNSVAIVLNGKVKISSLNKNNEERIYRYAVNGQIIGHRGIGSDYCFPISATALEETEILEIPLPLFESILRANSIFCYNFMLFFAEELKNSEKYITNIMNMSVSNRIAHAILLNVDTFGFDEGDTLKLAYTISRKDIATIAGTTYETTIRTLAKLQDKGLIQLINKEIRVLEVTKVRQMVSLRCKQD